MPRIDHYEHYETKPSYLIEAELFYEDMKFPLENQEIENPQKALEIVKILDKITNVHYKISRTIKFKRKDGYLSQEPPIEEKISVERLEKIIAEEEPLPTKEYPVYASLSPHSVDIGD